MLSGFAGGKGAAATTGGRCSDAESVTAGVTFGGTALSEDPPERVNMKIAPAATAKVTTTPATSDCFPFFFGGAYPMASTWSVGAGSSMTAGCSAVGVRDT